MAVRQEGTVAGVGWLGAADEGRVASGSVFEGEPVGFSG